MAASASKSTNLAYEQLTEYTTRGLGEPLKTSPFKNCSAKPSIHTPQSASPGPSWMERQVQHSAACIFPPSPQIILMLPDPERLP
ncbi:hypothetical protein NXS19_000303 [Fusarium pseudograminearum]|nr:hypothetical protein NXS19_000303 [Fusarium pseudograminearum]